MPSLTMTWCELSMRSIVHPFSCIVFTTCLPVILEGYNTYIVSSSTTANQRAYLESQKQRYLERHIRAAKRALSVWEAKGDAKNADLARQTVRDRQKTMRDFIAGTGRTRRGGREQVYDRGMKPVQETRAAFGIGDPKAKASLSKLVEVQGANPGYVAWFDKSKFSFKALGESAEDSRIFYAFEQKSHEWEENLVTARLLVSKGLGDVYLLHDAKGKQKGLSSPDAVFLDRLYDFKVVGDAALKTMEEHARKAAIQAGRMVMRLTDESSLERTLAKARRVAEMVEELQEMIVIGRRVL